MAELARSNKVLWLNSIATRAPSLTSGRDIKKIFRKVAAFFRGTKHIQDQLWVYTPVVLPLPYSAAASWLNRRLLRLMLWRIRRQLGMKRFQLWSFLPSAAEYVGALGEDLVVYYCTDEWSKFTYVHGEKTAQAERKLIEHCDVVFATAQSLVDDRIKINPRTYLARHGVDQALFAQALDPATAVPPDIAAIQKPILGFYGTIQDWIDFDLLIFLAHRHPEWSIVLLGQIFVDVSRLAAYPNIHLLGRREHPTLPSYCKAFDVGIIPYVVNERIGHVNPIKLREYFSAGLPVVSTAFPEVQRYPRYCTAAISHEQFAQGVIEALKSDSPALRLERSEAMKAETWEKRVAQCGELVEEAMAQKGLAGAAVANG